MRTSDILLIATVERLAKTIESRRLNEKLERQLKGDIKILMGDNNILEAGPFMVTIKKQSRTSLDLGALKEKLGSAEMKRFETITSYEILEVLKNNMAQVGTSTLEFNIKRLASKR